MSATRTPDPDSDTGAQGSPSEEFLLRVAHGADRSPASEDGGLPVDLALVGLGSAATRFELRRRLGAGGFGTVYEAFDRERNAVVALKALARRDPAALYHFKQEFRALADLAHPNLVQLYELHGDGGRWFFTMELVEGQDAQAYVQATGRGSSGALHSPGSQSTAPAPLASPSEQPPAAPPPLGPLAPASFDEIRVRALFQQLARGLCFLHGAGRLHRDVKPSNVMVARDGRVVLLDFGLVVELSAAGESGGAGTPSYMAPEQAGDQPLGPAADWYAAGVMLYQALTDRLPFDGSAIQILSRKATEDPPPPSAVVDGVPEDLDRLCMELLRRSPELRPSGRDVLEWLSRGAGVAAPPPSMDPATSDATFVGRGAELSRLLSAFDAARAGRTAAALVHGGSGMGKSALAGRFLRDLEGADARLVVLAGRCFEQESVPYKALDSAIDALGRLLQKMPPAEVLAILPRDVAAIARLFPALGRIREVGSAPRGAEPADRLELRRRAFAALRELFARLGALRPVVVFIDDLQWGDADSAALLADLLRPPGAPAMLFAAAYRTEEAERSECLRALLPALRSAGGAGLDLREILVERLDDGAAFEVALAALGERAAASPGRASAIARESAGWPFFIHQLCRFTGDPAEAGGAQPSLQAMLDARVGALPDGARRLLEVIAVAGQPLERGTAGRAAGLGDEEPSVLGLLRRQQMLLVRSGGSRDEIEAYHDRIRETVLARLGEGAKEGHHLRLAAALEATGRADPETLAAHFAGAGEVAKAAEHSLAAADLALEVLGFDRAARLYRQTIAWLGEDDPRRRALHEKLGVALGNTRRGPEAAAAYLVAAPGAGAAHALELRRRAADHYLTSGYVEEGLEVLRSVLAEAGMSMPATPLGTLLRMLPLLLLLRFRGLRFRERPEGRIPAADLLRIDACAVLRTGLVVVDPLTAAYFQKRHLWLALRAGEPYRLLRALNNEASLRAQRGREIPTAFEEELDRTALSLAGRLGDPGLFYRTQHGMSLTLRCRFREARPELEGAEEQLRESSVRQSNSLAICRFYLVQALYYLGEWKELVRRQAAFVEDARERGDRLLEAMLSALTGHVPALVADDPDAARDAVDRAGTLWARTNQFQHYAAMVALASTALYRDAGAGDAALALVGARWSGIVRSRLMTLNVAVRTQCLSLRGLGSLGAVASSAGGRREELLQAVDRDARAMGRIGSRIARAGELCLRAGLAAARGDRGGAVALLEGAERGLAALDMGLHAAAVRRRRGETVGGDEGRSLIESADAVMRAQEIRNPARMAAMFLPGRW